MKKILSRHKTFFLKHIQITSIYRDWKEKKKVFGSFLVSGKVSVGVTTVNILSNSLNIHNTICMKQQQQN